MPYDPKSSLTVKVDLNSPQAVDYFFFYKRPGDEKWTRFASSNESSDYRISQHTYTLDPLPVNTNMLFYFHLAGNPQTAYKILVTKLQNGREYDRIPIEGTTDKDGLATETRKEQLV